MSFYLNGVRLSDFAYISADQDNNDPALVQAGGSPNGTLTLGSYDEAQVGDLETALAAFIDSVGYPWITVGKVANMPWSNGTKGVLAVNLDNISFAFSDGSTGVKFAYSEPSFGYEPWGSYAEAAAGITALLQNVTWSPSS